MTSFNGLGGKGLKSAESKAASPGAAVSSDQSEMFRRVVEESPELIARFDRKLCHVYVNRATVRAFGASREQLLGRAHRQLDLPEALVSRWEQALNRVFTTGAEEAFYVCTSLNGRERCFDARIIPEFDAQGDVQTVFGMTRDVTDVMSVGKALRESESKCRVVMEASLAGICVYQNGTFLYVNPAMAELFGYEPLEMIGYMGPLDLVVPEQREMVAERMESRAGGRQGRPYEVRCVARDGSVRDVIAWGATVLLQGQAASVGTLIDITERKRAEDQVWRLQQHLARVSRFTTLDGMASGLAHEINQPLTAVINYAQACRNLLGNDLAGDGTRVGELMNHVVQQGQRAGQIIQRMRRLARHSAGQRQPLDMNAMVKESIQFVDWELRQRRIQLRLNRTRELPLVMADPVEIQQVLLNLLQNAVKALEQQPGTREIEIGTATLQDTDHWAEVWVADNGPGVTVDNHRRLLEPFFTTKPGGLGFGLPISNSIIESHGGVLVLPEPGPSPTFRFRLPALGEALVKG
ncbi:PAS domain S-box protein [Aquisalimonas sp.]|uniref:PAS domain S-box protein n=1 Tax=Aquisalimonas sp. TaxID=1872621 RepID=UPI0025BFB7AD|nr:PAS domain S-box protein [Aquisalimonas sp.]